jgi:hypothetical protein
MRLPISTRTATVVIGSLLVSVGIGLGAGVAQAQSSDITFDEGSGFTSWGQGHVTIDGFNGDGISSEGTVPTGAGDALQAVFGASTGLDLPVNVKSWLADKAMQAVDGLITVEPAGQPVQDAEPVDGGVPAGGVSQNEEDGDTAVAQNDEDTEEEDPDCPDCPEEDAFPNPDDDGDPTDPAAFDRSRLVTMPTDDGGGPWGPASLIATQGAVSYAP